MIKNKIMYIKIIFKIYLKILKIFWAFKKNLFYKTYYNNFQNLFLKTKLNASIVD